MKQKEGILNIRKPFLFAALFFMLCMWLACTVPVAAAQAQGAADIVQDTGQSTVRAAAQTATLSMKNIETVTGGRFLERQNGRVYRLEDGTRARNCVLRIDGKIYCFSTDGYMLYGWQKIENYYYYFGKKTEGYMYRKCWLQNGNKYYWLRKSGKRAQNGWLEINGKTYYFSQYGTRYYGWRTIGSRRYFFGRNNQGWLYKSTFLTYKGQIYYLRGDGSMALGWKVINGSRYCFNADGQAYTGKQKISDTVYYFDSKGRLLRTGANLSIGSDCAILIDADTGAMLYGKNETSRHANASTTKILTCILALENCRLNEKVTVSANAEAQEPTKLYMQAGQTFYMKDLLYSLMLPSHNDTAVAIAEHISGSTGKFVALMNQKAREIGCTRTNFVTPNGLDQGLNHYTTASDIAKIAAYAYKNSTFRKIVNTSHYSFSSLDGTRYTVYTTNSLLGNMTGVKGMKTGYTDKAGYCFVGVIQSSSGKTYISVNLGGSSSAERWEDARALLEYAYTK